MGNCSEIFSHKEFDFISTSVLEKINYPKCPKCNLGKLVKNHIL